MMINDDQIEAQFVESFAIRLLHSATIFLSPSLSSMEAASVSIPALSAGEASSWAGRCLQANTRARACSLSPLYSSLSPPARHTRLRLLMVWLEEVLSSNCWVLLGLAPAIRRRVASWRNSLEQSPVRWELR